MVKKLGINNKKIIVNQLNHIISIAWSKPVK